MLNSFYAINYSNVINLNENKLKFGFNLKQKNPSSIDERFLREVGDTKGFARTASHL